jgi:ribonuclease P protein component
MQRRHRLSRSQDFDAVYRKGRSTSTRYLVLYWFPREEDAGVEPRLGLAVPKSVGNAVARNRARRLLRECFRLHQRELASPLDVVLVARASIAGRTLGQVRKDYLPALRRAALLRDPGAAPVPPGA